MANKIFWESESKQSKKKNLLEDQKELLDKLYRGEITRTNDKNYIEWYKKKFKRECLAKVFKTKIIFSIQSKLLECMKY